MSFTELTVTHPVKLPPPFRAVLTPGVHKFPGDWRGYFRNTKERRLIEVGIITLNFRDEATASETVSAPTPTPISTTTTEDPVTDTAAVVTNPTDISPEVTETMTEPATELAVVSDTPEVVVVDSLDEPEYTDAEPIVVMDDEVITAAPNVKAEAEAPTPRRRKRKAGAEE